MKIQNTVSFANTFECFDGNNLGLVSTGIQALQVMGLVDNSKLTYIKHTNNDSENTLYHAVHTPFHYICMYYSSVLTAQYKHHARVHTLSNGIQKSQL